MATQGIIQNQFTLAVADTLPELSKMQVCCRTHRLKFDVYICTTALRAYALEVWRLLDLYCMIIDRNLVPHRMINVSQGKMKCLSNAFQIGPLNTEATSPQPVAIIADDRCDVSCQCLLLEPKVRNSEC